MILSTVKIWYASYTSTFSDGFNLAVAPQANLRPEHEAHLVLKHRLLNLIIKQPLALEERQVVIMSRMQAALRTTAELFRAKRDPRVRLETRLLSRARLVRHRRRRILEELKPRAQNLHLRSAPNP